MKQIGHGVDEDEARPAPFQRVFKSRLVHGDGKRVPVLLHSHRLQSPGQPFCIAELAPGANLRASRDRVPGDLVHSIAERVDISYRFSRMWRAMRWAVPTALGLRRQRRTGTRTGPCCWNSDRVRDRLRNLSPNNLPSLVLVDFEQSFNAGGSLVLDIAEQSLLWVKAVQPRANSHRRTPSSAGPPTRMQCRPVSSLLGASVRSRQPETESRYPTN